MAVPPAVILSERHHDFADAVDTGHAATAGNTEFISFAIGNDQYGVDIMAVREIKGWSEITHLPKQPEYVRGVLNLRGVIVPIVDLRCRFGQGVTEATPLHVVIIVQIDQQLVGLLADRVLDIVSFELLEGSAGAAYREHRRGRVPFGPRDGRQRDDRAHRPRKSLHDQARHIRSCVYGGRLRK